MSKPDTFFLDAYGNGKPFHVVDKRDYDALAEKFKAAEYELTCYRLDGPAHTLSDKVAALEAKLADQTCGYCDFDRSLSKERNQLRERVKELEHRLCLADEGFKTVVEENTELIQLRERVKELEANVAEYDHGMAGDLIRERNALRAKAEGLVEVLKLYANSETYGDESASGERAREALAKWKEEK